LYNKKLYKFLKIVSP